MIVQNHMGDVLKYIFPDTQEEIRYTMFGVPFAVNWYADVNHDGGVDGDDTLLFMQWWDSSDGLADINRDGGVDGDDLFLYFSWWNDGRGQDSLADNRFGYRGYVFDDRLQLYHVRHRVYDPMPGPTGMRPLHRLQRDPAMFIDGLNLYAYCQGDPVNGVDPMGLESWLVGSILRSVGLPEWGDHVDDAVDGAAELGSYWSDVESLNQVTQDASDPEARQDVHDALQTAKEVADRIPGGELAGHAVNIVDKGLAVWDEHVDGTNASNCGPGGSYISPAFDDLIESIAEGVVDRSKGKKADGPSNKLRSDSNRGHGSRHPEGLGPNGGVRDRATQERLAAQKAARNQRREDRSRDLGEGPGNATRSGEGFRNRQEANRGPRGIRPGERNYRNRERNIGIDEEHSRVAKGTGGGQGVPR
jgi:RHS repeat-associated protein